MIRCGTTGRRELLAGIHALDGPGACARSAPCLAWHRCRVVTSAPWPRQSTAPSAAGAGGHNCEVAYRHYVKASEPRRSITHRPLGKPGSCLVFAIVQRRAAHVRATHEHRSGCDVGRHGHASAWLRAPQPGYSGRARSCSLLRHLSRSSCLGPESRVCTAPHLDQPSREPTRTACLSPRAYNEVKSRYFTLGCSR
jgi:hypothetical protein